MRLASVARDARRRVSACLAAVLLVCAATTTARAARPLRAVEISRDRVGAGVPGAQADTEAEAHVAVDPTNPDVVVAVFQQGRFESGGGAAGIGFATSHDGGGTWTGGPLPGITAAAGGPFARATDPVVAFGPDGVVYANTLALGAECDHALLVSRSTDGGLTWAPPVAVEARRTCEPFLDKNWIALDADPTSPWAGRLYVAATLIDGARGSSLVVFVSDDGGTTWSTARTASDGTFRFTQGVLPLVRPGGALTIVYGGQPAAGAPRGRLVSRASSDGGVTFGPLVPIADDRGRPIVGLRASVSIGWNLPAAAVDPVRGTLHVAWVDATGPGGRFDAVVLSRSDDGGSTWTVPRVVSPRRRMHFFTPAVAAHDGRVLVAFAGARSSRGRVTTWATTSRDGGLGFERSRRVGPSGRLAFAARAGDGRFLGDYAGAAASPRAAHAVWCLPTRPPAGSAAPRHQTTWSAAIRWPDAATPAAIRAADRDVRARPPAAAAVPPPVSAAAPQAAPAR